LQDLLDEGRLLRRSIELEVDFSLTRDSDADPRLNRGAPAAKGKARRRRNDIDRNEIGKKGD
jgi:hypothetical protein